MDLLYAVLLGLVQGAAEFLPISSSGHLALMERIPGADALAVTDDSAAFNVMLHLATLTAVVIAYRRDVRDMGAELLAMARELRRREGPAGGNVPARRLILMIAAAALPLVLVLPVRRAVESLGKVPWFIGLSLIVTGLLLFIADRVPAGRKTERDMTLPDALLIGLAQAAATLPGVSRSGATITVGVSRGLTRSFAVKLSFLMSLPAVLGAAVLKAVGLIGAGPEPGLLPVYLAGMAVAGVTGYLSIRLLKRIADRGRFGGFAYYCCGVGALTVVLSLIL